MNHYSGAISNLTVSHKIELMLLLLYSAWRAYQLDVKKFAHRARLGDSLVVYITGDPLGHNKKSARLLAMVPSKLTLSLDWETVGYF